MSLKKKPHIKKSYLALGLMSGTSGDGIDVSLVRTDGDGQIEAISFETFPYKDGFKSLLKECTIPSRRKDPNFLQSIGQKLGMTQVSDADRAANQEFMQQTGIGINPQTDGQLIRLPIPKLSEERREELAKVVSKYAENSKIAIRNIRREIMDSIKKSEKDKNISQDEMKKKSFDVQKMTDEYVSKIDLITSTKQTEILKL